ncbi:hypothetical protein GCM10027051_15590 [Niabella terrae]
MKKFLLYLTVLFTTGRPLGAQVLKDNLYVQLMDQELKRNMQRLRLPDLGAPFFISYQLRNQYYLNLRAERGELLSYERTPANRKTGSIRLLVGDYHRNFDYMLRSNGGFNLPQQPDDMEYRRIFWLETDKAYKNNAQLYSNFSAALKRLEVDKEELALDDLSKIAPVQKDYGPVRQIAVDIGEWEQRLRALSSLFNKDPRITQSGCSLTLSEYEDYLVSSEGTRIRMPDGYAGIRIFAAYSEEGEARPRSKSYVCYASSVAELPTQELLKKQVVEMIKDLQSRSADRSFEGAYMGPVLYESGAVINLINEAFGETLSTRRKNILGYENNSTDFEEKLGQKLVAAELNLLAVPGLKSFQGRRTTGAFEIDNEGVQPPDTLELIRQGILKGLLNDRTPTRKFPRSLGFSRSSMGKGTQPGVLVLKATRTSLLADMKRQLLKAATAEGLKEAYIVRGSPMGAPELYHVDLLTGQEYRVTGAKLGPMTLRGLRRFQVAADSMQLHNGPDFSVISPQAMIVNEVEIEKLHETTKPRPIIVSNPLLDPPKRSSSGTGKKKKSR